MNYINLTVYLLCKTTTTHHLAWPTWCL